MQTVLIVVHLFIVLALIGVSPYDGLSSLLRGAFGSKFALTQTALKAIPLALTGLAVAVCLRMRLWNIGAEGQFHVGAIGATWAALTFSTASASIWPIVGSLLAEIVPTCAISSFFETGREIEPWSLATATSTAFSIPRRTAVGLAPEVMLRRPSR